MNFEGHKDFYAKYRKSLNGQLSELRGTIDIDLRQFTLIPIL
jgi:hypothetical protein